MAIISSHFLNYLTIVFNKSLSNNTSAFYSDQLLLLTEYCIDPNEYGELTFLTQYSFSEKKIKQAREAYSSHGIIGIFISQFDNGILNQFVNKDIERKVITLKKGFPSLPATKASIILKGFQYNLETDDILSIYASHGFAQGMKNLVEHFDFKDINRRVANLAQLISQGANSENVKKVQLRYLTIRKYLTAETKEREMIIKSSGLKRSLFFFYWKNFNKYGLLGLIDKGNEVFRESKMGLDNEAKIIIDKIQYPDRKENFYVKMLKTKGIVIERSSISKIFSKWKIVNYKSEFVSNLKRLESYVDDEIEKLDNDYESANDVERYVDINYIKLLKGTSKQGVYVDAPGIFILWVYIEELGIYPMIKKLGLIDSNGKGYSWFDHFLLNIARIFYGISSYSRTCEHESPIFYLFSHLVSLPCNDSFLNGLGRIKEDQVFELQKWLVNRIKELGIINGQRLAFDFKQIDIDVELGNLRQIGKGPSPKKKVCYSGFRPHIAWDLDTGSIIIAEFRKSSARGTTTVKRFVKDFLSIKSFKNSFKEIYVDSEYTGKDVWNFILDNNGMNADITACLKQNKFVKKARDQFLFEQSNNDDFWCFYDEKHVFSSKTFTLSWEYQINHDPIEKKTFTLYCVVKKNIKDGKLRCFGTSKKGMTPKEILEDYSHRWIIENGIKDLVQSYFLDNCPGTKPHHVNIHFLIVSICRQIYSLIQRDLGTFIKNHNESVKSLNTMRDLLFRQGSASVSLKQDCLEIKYMNSYSPKLTQELNNLYKKIYERTPNGLSILGGLQLKFVLKPPISEEHKNGMKKVPLSTLKKNK